ncbi:GDSL esterase/lipase At1g29670-like [Coffea arabica]|uniref:GDSL esterase/lipase At1g29670-like n=1 Tax=Coffea arabica TaxID=13443 RepID=A0A6P6VEZ9_COFAR|nr:GDSL esterase/lipase At1g29670-like [Coffea arabica]
MGFLFNIWIFVFMGLVRFDMQFVLGAPQVPCYFSFGDSIADNGNNNNLPTIAKANYPPYGIDFPDGSTGRYTNGRNIPDFIAQLLGFDNFIPPYATARGQDIIKGVNYGSGGAGIRDETSFQQGARISFNQQLQNHGRTISRISLLHGGPTSAKDYLSKCLYTVLIGSNDYLNNYFLPQIYSTSRTYTPDQYAEVLIRQFSQQLKTLYNYGARKIALFGLGALGCIPAVIDSSGGTTCVDSVNAAVQIFNGRLKPLVDDLNSQLVGAKFIYLNTSSIQSGDPTSLGIQFFTEPCCQVDSSTGLCISGSTPCCNRTQYAFYDAIHPTETVYQAYSVRAFYSVLPSDAYPMDIRHLAQL